MGLIRSLISLALFLGLLLFSFTVPIGERTLSGHVVNIWSSNEAQELVEGVKESGQPLVERVKRGVEAGLSDAQQAEKDGSVAATPAEDESEPSDESQSD